MRVPRHRPELLTSGPEVDDLRELPPVVPCSLQPPGARLEAATVARRAAAPQTDFSPAFCSESHQRLPLRAATACSRGLRPLLATTHSFLGMPAVLRRLNNEKGAGYSLHGNVAVTTIADHRCRLEMLEFHHARLTRPNVRAKPAPAGRRRARAVENVPRHRPGPVACRWGSA